MANGHGGYREPANPAPVSGPGALSQRTDGQATRRLPNAAYGESKAFEEQQKAAKVAERPAPIDVSGLTPMDAETQFPDRPVTDGVNAGLGAGQSDLDEEDLLHLGNYMPDLKLLASQSYATNATKQYVRQLAALQPER